MKPRSEYNPALGVKKTEFMQNSSFNFIENERMCNVVQRGGVLNYQTDECDSTIRDSKHTHLKTISKTEELSQKSSTHSMSTPTKVLKVEKRKKIIPAEITKNGNDFFVKVVNKPIRVRTETVISTKERTQPGRYAPKRYVTKCYFEPKQNPISYSETVIITLGSKKKQFFETVVYETKLIPFRWTESMMTLTPAAEGNNFEARHEVTVPGDKFHYMSLEPQQIAAKEKAVV